MSLERLPKLDERGHDVHTGGVAPPGRRFLEVAGKADLRIPAFGANMRKTGKAIVEVADMWQPGNGDMGLTPTREGRILPSIDHVRCVIPLTDVMGADLDDTDTDREAMRRSWYASMMRSGPRLTPVHHIIGQSDPAWHGSMPAALSSDRDTWRAKVWEPKNLRALMETYTDIYALDWAHLPEGRILAPLEKVLRKMRDDRRAEATLAALRVRRAKAEIRVVSALGVAVQAWMTASAASDKASDKKAEAAALTTATKQWEQLRAIAANYEREAAKCDAFAETPLEVGV